MNSILATIEDSGNGLKEGSAWHILMFGHALDLLAAHDRHYGKARVVSRSVEYVPLLEPVRTEEGRIKDITSITAASTGTNPTTTYSNGPEPGNSTTCVRENTNNENRS